MKFARILSPTKVAGLLLLAGSAAYLIILVMGGWLPLTHRVEGTWGRKADPFGVAVLLSGVGLIVLMALLLWRVDAPADPRDGNRPSPPDP